MRVVQVADYGSPYAGSFLAMLETALAATRERGWDALAVLPARAREREWFPAFEEANRPDVVVAPEGGHRDLTRALEHVLGSAPHRTMLHAHFSKFDVPVALLARQRLDVRAIWHFHTALSASLSARVRNRVRVGLGARYVDRMLCVSRDIVDGLRARGAPAGKLVYFPNGVDVDRFAGRAGAEERAAARAALSVPRDATVVLHIGRDWHLKGGDLFLDAFERLDGDGFVGLMIRGGEVARREVERRGIAGRVRVLEGTTAVRRLHAATDVMLATSRGEGHPFSVLEALSSGVPVVATDIAGHALAEIPPPGLRITPPRPDAIASAARSLLERKPEDARRESSESHDWVRERFSMTVWGARLLAVYDEIADSWRHGSGRG